jgi:CII-binding regulator of phage lambda lysogenization HflD
MVFGWLARKKEVEEIKKEIKGSFSNVKQDIDNVGQWINHLNSSDEKINSRLNSLFEDVYSIKDEIEQLKEVISMFGEGVSKQMFKTNSHLFKEKTGVDVEQTSVQTGVQTDSFYEISGLSTTEKAIIWLLINNDLKLSYEDIASMLGKRVSTIRGQINSIKQKSESLIKEYIEKNGKKRVYIPEEIKEKIVKKAKVRVKEKKNNKK